MTTFKDLDIRRKEFFISGFLIAEVLAEQLAAITEADEDLIVALARTTAYHQLKKYSERDVEKIIESCEEDIRKSGCFDRV